MIRMLAVLLLLSGLTPVGLQAGAVTAFPRLSVREGAIEAVSASARVTLGWMQEGERRRYFPEMEPDTLLMRVDSVQVLRALSGSADVVVEASLCSGTAKPNLEFGDVTAPVAFHRAEIHGQRLVFGPGGRVTVRQVRFAALPLQRQDAKRGASRAHYALELNLETSVLQDCGPVLELDLGRKVAARLMRTEPDSLMFKRLQNLTWCVPSSQERRVVVSIADTVLKNYPPMNLRQRDASQRLVMDMARHQGRIR